MECGYAVAATRSCAGRASHAVWGELLELGIAGKVSARRREDRDLLFDREPGQLRQVGEDCGRAGQEHCATSLQKVALRVDVDKNKRPWKHGCVAFGHSVISRDPAARMNDPL